MKRIFASLVLILVCAMSAFATDITVSSHQISGYAYTDAAPKIRVYVSQGFLDSLGVWVPGSAVGSANWYRTISATANLSTDVLTIPSFTLPSTVNGSPSTSRYTLVLYTGATKRETLYSNLRMPTSYGTTITVAQWITDNQAVPTTPRPGFPDTQQVQTLISTAVGTLNDASDVVKGRAKLSVAPVSSSNPIAVGDNDPRVTGTMTALNVLDHGAVADAAVQENCAMSATANAVTCTGASFTSALNGKKAVIAGAGVGGATLIATISGASGTTFTSSVSASTTVSGTRVVTGTENTAAFIAALAAAGASTTARTVNVPTGNYLFTTPGGLGTMPVGTTLRGSWESVPNHMGYRFTNEPKPMDGKGTTLVVASDEGTATGRFLRIDRDATARGLVVFHPAQLTSLAAPKVYPPVFELYGSTPALLDTELVNPYFGVYSHVGQRHRVRNVHGQPLHLGLYVSQILDMSYYENIEWSPTYTFNTGTTGVGAATPLANYVQNFATAFKLGRVDGGEFVNCFNYAYWKGIKFVIDASESDTYAGGTGIPGGGAPGGAAFANFNGGGSDGNVISIDADEVQGGSSVVLGFTGPGVTFTNFFVSPAPYTVTVTLIPANADLYGLITNGATFTGRLRFTSSHFASARRQATVAGTGLVTFTNSVFEGGTSGTSIYAVGPTSGTVPLTLLATGNFFVGGSGVGLENWVVGSIAHNSMRQMSATAAIATTLHAGTNAMQLGPNSYATGNSIDFGRDATSPRLVWDTLYGGLVIRPVGASVSTFQGLTVENTNSSGNTQLTIGAAGQRYWKWTTGNSFPGKLVLKDSDENEYLFVDTNGLNLTNGPVLTEGRLSTTASVNMNTATASTLYTCPTGKSCVITKVVVRNASTSLTTASYSFGWVSAGFNDVIANATHTELTGATLYTPIVAKVGARVGTTTEIFKVLMNTLQGGAATATIDVYGFTF